MAAKKIKAYMQVLDQNQNLKGSLSVGQFVKSKILNKTLLYKVYLPPVNKIENALPVIYINDGFSYINKGKMPQLLDNLIITNKIKPVVVVFLSPRDKTSKKKVRQELFLCNPKFVDFFRKEFMPMLEKKYPISNKREDRTILGLSFGGLAAAYIADRASNDFKNIAMQSPAFHPCPDIYKAYKVKPKKDFKIYLSYGTRQDTESQSIPMVRILKKRNFDLKIKREEGGNHDWNLWESQLEGILLYFFIKKN